VKQHLTVTIADPAASQQAWGFQLTARLVSDTTQMAGTFDSTDANTTIICSATNLRSFVESPYSAAKAQSCAASMPLQYMEHSLKGYQTNLGQRPSSSYSFDWTPPATSAGNVTIYVTGNAGPGGPPTQGNAHVYTASYTLSPAAAGSSPTIKDVVTAGIGGPASFEAGSFVEIDGANLANTNPGRIWNASTEIINGNLPTKLDGVSVTINGKPAFIYYISPTQINLQAPSDTATGSVQVVVNNNGATTTFSGNLQTYSPAFFAWNGSPYPVATRYPDNAFIANPSAVAGTVAAKQGDVLILWGTGFGPTNPALTAGIVLTAPLTAATNPTVSIDGADVQVLGSAMSYAGEYQVAIQLPKSLSNGDHSIVASVGGISSPTGTKIFIAN
jgi:uncharacterized protein (TIGR03437 family)